jgi:murein DD-endopeptidase / murein LD-carboxypeptidase
MTDCEACAVTRARGLVGVRFRPQGRDPATGLDCVGVVLQVFEIPAERVRRDYRLTGNRANEIEAELSRYFEPVRRTESRAGDVVLCSLRTGQLHLAVHCGCSFVHADARARRVVEMPGAPQWRILGTYRFAPRDLQPS